MSRNLKKSMSSDLLKPRMSVLDPTYTYTVSRRQTAAGTADIISHAFENYFSPVKDFYIGYRFGEAVLRTCFHYGPIAMEQPDNYEARANLMWASTNAISGITKFGSDCGWSCHPMEHELSAYYDITHGVGLAILTPRWMKHVLNEETAWKFGQFGREVWGLTGEDDMEIGKAAIDKTAEFFFDVLGLPRTLTEVGIGEEKLEIMAENCGSRLSGVFVPLNKQDVLEIFRDCL